MKKKVVAITYLFFLSLSLHLAPANKKNKFTNDPKKYFFEQKYVARSACNVRRFDLKFLTLISIAHIHQYKFTNRESYMKYGHIKREYVKALECDYVLPGSGAFKR